MVKDSGISTITKNNPDFPKLLLEIPAPPKTLYYQGDKSLLEGLCIAIVGTRKATSQGLLLAREFAGFLASRGVVIVSGLALGIDAAAHEGALEAHGKTIAVLGNGLPEIYPRQNEQLAKEILEKGGLIISEYPTDTPSLPHQFLERNRIVSGISRGVIVVEAPQRSGALSTAAHALEQNREVFVLPGPVKHPNYKGSHGLIKAGACLVSSPEEVLEELNLASNEQTTNQKSGTQIIGRNDDEIKILEALQNAGKPLTLDKICELTRIGVSSAARTLGLLTMQGVIREENGKYYL